MRSKIDELVMAHEENKEQIHNQVAMQLHDDFIRNEKAQIEKTYKNQIESILTKYTNLMEENKTEIR